MNDETDLTAEDLLAKLEHGTEVQLAVGPPTASYGEVSIFAARSSWLSERYASAAVPPVPVH